MLPPPYFWDIFCHIYISYIKTLSSLLLTDFCSQWCCLFQQYTLSISMKNYPISVISYSMAHFVLVLFLTCSRFLIFITCSVVKNMECLFITLLKRVLNESVMLCDLHKTASLISMQQTICDKHLNFGIFLNIIVSLVRFCMIACLSLTWIKSLACSLLQKLTSVCWQTPLEHDVLNVSFMATLLNDGRRFT